MYKKRWIAQRLSTSLDFAKVIVLTGARQTGKTTLLKNESIFSDYKYFTTFLQERSSFLILCNMYSFHHI